MKFNNLIQLALFGLGIIFLASCETEGCTDVNASNFSPTATTDDGSCNYEQEAAALPENIIPEFGGDYAALIGIKTVTTVEQFGFTIDQELGVAVAVFNEGSALTDAGAVLCEGEALDQQSNNAYAYVPGTSNITGIVFEDDTDWSASGGTWPSVSITNTEDFSNVGEMNSPTTVDLGTSFIVSAESVTGADSVYFALYSPGAVLLKVLPGNANSHTFTAEEVSTLSEGSGYAQVVGLTYNEQNQDGRTYWLINETVRTETVTME